MRLVVFLVWFRFRFRSEYISVFMMHRNCKCGGFERWKKKNGMLTLMAILRIDGSFSEIRRHFSTWEQSVIMIH